MDKREVNQNSEFSVCKKEISAGVENYSKKRNILKCLAQS
jgi:hypothetical protein